MALLHRSAERKLNTGTFFFWVILLTILSIIPRYFGLSHITADIEACLLPWSAEVPAHQGIAVLKNFTGDYNMPYVTILWLLNYLPGSTLLKVKLFSIVFDYACAIVAGILITQFRDTAKDIYFLVTYGIILFYPVSIMNSAWWGQCDFVYVTFVLLSILALKNDRFALAMIWLGFAFSFKLQTIIILPFILLYLWKKHEFKLRYFIWVPIIMELLCIPAMIAGYSPLIPFSIYLRQFGRYPYMYVFYPNFWALFPDARYYIFGTATQLCIFLVLLLFVGSVIRQKEDIPQEQWFAYAVWTTLLMMCFLPCMHERYGLLLEILAILYAVLVPRSSWLAAILCAGITVSYLQVTFAQSYFSDQWIAVSMLLCLGAFSWFVFSREPKGESALYSRALEVFEEGEHGIYKINYILPLLALPLILAIALLIRYRMIECVSADYLPNLIEVEGNHHTGFYMWIMSILSHFDSKPLFFLTKILVALGDVLAAFSIGFMLALEQDGDALSAARNLHRTTSLEERKRMGAATSDRVLGSFYWKVMLFAGSYLMLPLTLMNSSIWAHFDSWCLFALTLSWHLRRKGDRRNMILSIFFAGIAITLLPHYLLIVVFGSILLLCKRASEGTASGDADAAGLASKAPGSAKAADALRQALPCEAVFVVSSAVVAMVLSLTGLSCGYTFRELLGRMNFLSDLHTYMFFLVIVSLLIQSFRNLLYLLPLTLWCITAIIDWGQFLYEQPLAPAPLILPGYIAAALMTILITALAVRKNTGGALSH